MQSRLESLIEVGANICIGFVISMFANMLILPMFGHGHPTFLNNLGMTAVFTVLSIVRGYVLRRWFNSRITNASRTVARVFHKE